MWSFCMYIILICNLTPAWSSFRPAITTAARGQWKNTSALKALKLHSFSNNFCYGNHQAWKKGGEKARGRLFFSHRSSPTCSFLYYLSLNSQYLPSFTMKEKSTVHIAKLSKLSFLPCSLSNMPFLQVLSLSCPLIAQQRAEHRLLSVLLAAAEIEVL